MRSPTTSDCSSQFGDSLDDFLSLYSSSSPAVVPDDFTCAYTGVRQYDMGDAAMSFIHGYFDYNQHQAFGYCSPPSVALPLAQSAVSCQITHSKRSPPTRSARNRSPKASSTPRAESSDDMDMEDVATAETVPPLPPNATPEERAIWIRRKNTLSARKNRKLRALKAQQLSEQATQLTIEKEMWKTRAETLRGLLSSHGIPCPHWV